MASSFTDRSPNEIQTVKLEEKTNDEIQNPVSPTSAPLSAERGPKRFPITSAIPLLSNVTTVKSHPEIPTPGTNGDLTQVYCNHFPVSLAPKKWLYQYDVVVEKTTVHAPGRWDEAMSRDQRRRFVQELTVAKVFDFVFW
jgi:hypothetical protein